MLVEGRLQTRSYTDREGNKRKAYEVLADTVRFLERMRDTEAPSGEYEAPTAPAAAPRTVQRTTPAAAASEPEYSDDYSDIDLDAGEFEDVAEDPFR